MGNMSYCRFQNTSLDFEECVDTFQEMVYEGGKLSREETRAFGRLLESVGNLMEAISNHTGMSYDEVLDNIGGDAGAFAKKILSTIPEPADDES